MKSIFQLSCAALVMCLLTSSTVLAQNQTIDGKKKKDDTSRYVPKKSPYTPYIKPPKPRIIDSRSLIQLDGGEANAPAFVGGGAPATNPNAAGMGNTGNNGPAGPSRFGGGSNNRNFVSGGIRGNRSGGLQVTFNNGARTINVDEATRKIKIVDDPNSGIIVEVTKTYGPRQMAQLKRKKPDLVDYIEMFPNKMGSDEVKLSIELTSKFSARDPEDLRRQDNSIYNIYQRFTKEANGQQGQQNANNQSQANDGYRARAPRRKRRNLPQAALGGGATTGKN